MRVIAFSETSGGRIEQDITNHPDGVKARADALTYREYGMTAQEFAEDMGPREVATEDGGTRVIEGVILWALSVECDDWSVLRIEAVLEDEELDD